MNNKLETIALVFLGLCIGCFLTAFIIPRQYGNVILGFFIVGAASFIIMIFVFALDDTQSEKQRRVEQQYYDDYAQHIDDHHTCMACKTQPRQHNDTLCSKCSSIYEAEGPDYLYQMYN